MEIKVRKLEPFLEFILTMGQVKYESGLLNEAESKEVAQLFRQAAEDLEDGYSD